jgi:ubiquinone/menaquinone biosynthesis C-methylase UbiE
VRVLTREQVRRVYARHASRYDLWANLTEARARRRALEVAAVRDGEAVLEVAVGTGLLFVELLARNPHGRTVGIDLTPAMLERARGKAERSGLTNWELRTGDAAALDCAEGSFDLVVSTYMFDLLSEADVERVLAELARVLRHGGRAVIANLAPSPRLAYRLWAFLYRRNPAWVGGCRGVELAEPLRRAGFTIEVRERVEQLTIATEIVGARLR